MEDQPNTQAAPVPATVITMPTNWLMLGANYSELLIKRIDMAVIDFYAREKH